MKQLHFLSTLGIAFILFLSSCGGNEKKTDTAVTESTTIHTDSTTTPATAESTVSTTPENVLIVWQKVADFAKWKAVYDTYDSARLASGIHSFIIGRDVDDSNMVLVATKVDDVAKAKAFANSPGLKAAMKKGGVLGMPLVAINTVVYQDNAKNMSDLRSMTMFTVKDWDAWKKSFESSRQLREDNGLTDRAYGYDADNNHKVTLVLGINDTAKANVFWKSDVLKQKRAESGVVGEVKRHVYRVVQKY